VYTFTGCLFNLQVNEALNSLYIEAEDYDALGKSIEDYDNIDQIGPNCCKTFCLNFSCNTLYNSHFLHVKVARFYFEV